MRGGAVAARRAHNPKVAGSSPAPATFDHVFYMVNFLWASFGATCTTAIHKTGIEVIETAQRDGAPSARRNPQNAERQFSPALIICLLG